MRGEVAVRLFTMYSNRLTQGLTQGLTQKLKGKRCDTLVKYDRWTQTYWKTQIEGDLTEEEQKELEEVEKENMKTVVEVYKALKEDVKIKELIEKIKSHKWIKTIEREENV